MNIVICMRIEDPKSKIIGIQKVTGYRLVHWKKKKKSSRTENVVLQLTFSVVEYQNALFHYPMHILILQCSHFS